MTHACGCSHALKGFLPPRDLLSPLLAPGLFGQQALLRLRRTSSSPLYFDFELPLGGYCLSIRLGQALVLVLQGPVPRRQVVEQVDIGLCEVNTQCPHRSWRTHDMCAEHLEHGRHDVYP